jgi:Na+-transporting methylmalonyl-CoA/oxaloacetate decarboxylase gamma subunit
MEYTMGIMLAGLVFVILLLPILAFIVRSITADNERTNHPK